ncbi:MAG: hypothetical protein K0R51_51 [Cytophagaceae bacterium]|jgi:hypothetical protein|nr:hypothetical protein [Cytophagaceae bacterium]
MKKIILLLGIVLLLVSCKKEEAQPQASNGGTTDPVDTTDVTDTSGCIQAKALQSGEWVVYARVINGGTKTFFDPTFPVNVTASAFGFNGNTAPATYSSDGTVIYTNTASGSGSGQYNVSVYACEELKLSDGSLQAGLLYEYYLKKKK